MNTVRGGTVDTLEIFSISMQKTIKCLVVLPDSYSVQARPYPLVFLLHGWSGNFAGWLGDAPQLRQHVDNYNIIVVCPDGGYDSWYLDSPVDSTVRYETHVMWEALPLVEYYYNVRRDRAGRAIAGLSMGGHGALLLAARHPDIFGAAGSMCGGLDLRDWKRNDWDLKGVLGSPRDFWDNWEAFSVVNQVESLKKAAIQIIIDCGTDDFFLPSNRKMHRRLLEAEVPHEYTERPGAHNSEYWANAIDFQILFFVKFFDRTR